MKVRAHKTRSVLYLFARFEEYKVCEFLATASCMTSRLSSADVREHAFYVLVKPSQMAEIYRKGEFICHVFPEGDEGWKSPKFGFKLLEAAFPLFFTKKEAM